MPVEIAEPAARTRKYGRHLAWLAAILMAVAVPAAHPARAAHEVSAHAFFSGLGLKANWIKSGDKEEFKSPWTDIVLDSWDRVISFDGTCVFLGYPVTAHSGELYIDQTDIDAFFQPLLRPQDLPSIAPIRKIVIDPGHGGKDTGTQNTRLHLNEKDFTLDVGKRLQTLLRKRGYQVLLTRHNDSFIPLDQRPAIANKYGADLFISIHFNASDDTSVRGTETYILTPRYQKSTNSPRAHASDAEAQPGNRSDSWNAVFGFTFHQDVLKELDTPDRGLRRARFAVLRDLHCPGLLIEAAYLSHVADAKKLKTRAYRQRLATAFADAIDDFARTAARISAKRH